MKPIPTVLAQAIFHTLALHSTALFVVLLILIVAAAFVWAAFFRGRSSRPQSIRRHHWRDDKSSRNGSARGTENRRGTGRHRKHRKRRPTNPTLAQTHGLPPARDEKSTPPSY